METLNKLRVTLLQTDIVWENIGENLNRLYDYLSCLKGKTDLVILPEMFSTGFSMNSDELAESMEDATPNRLREWAGEFGIAITGSFIAGEDGINYNRGFITMPGHDFYFYDKRHLFRMGDEVNHFCAGNNRLTVNYRGWNICLLICYDLRFPVWSRNVDNEYDLLIYVANWPASRRLVWDALLPARALENMSYVCAVNRVGVDGNDLTYNGGSVVYSPRGECLGRVPDNEEGMITVEIDRESLRRFREKFPAWMDADKFTIKN